MSNIDIRKLMRSNRDKSKENNEYNGSKGQVYSSKTNEYEPIPDIIIPKKNKQMRDPNNA